MHTHNLCALSIDETRLICYDNKKTESAMKKRVTIQDIADALSISRNTVSKAINNSDGIADATRDMILRKAAEMGYKQFSYIQVAAAAQRAASAPRGAPEGPTEIALFTTVFLANSHFASLMLDKLQRELTQLGYTMSTHRVTQRDRDEMALPVTFNRDRTAAILCVEMFDRRYDEMVCSLGLPVLFVDGPVKLRGRSLPADELYMDNMTEGARFLYEMLDRGVRRIGFIGDYEHCQSFYERYAVFRWAMLAEGLPVDERFIIKSMTREDISARLRALEELPELFLCANDFIAMDTLYILTDMGLSVPDDVMICGFDDAAESRLITPALTTIHIHTQSMAFSAAQLLLTRIREPSLDYRTMYTETELIYRESTRRPEAEDMP